MRRPYLLALCLATAVVPSATAQEIGPAKGSLVIVGGGRIDDAILARFLDLAGGQDAPIVVIPTASGDGDYGPYWAGLSGFKALGATNLSVLHTTDRAVANTDAFVQPLRAARGVWFVGGRQWRLADAYLHTKVQDELNALLERGGVIGGTSAGATIQGSYLVRGDTRTNTIMMGDHVEGMVFLKHTAIDQHVLRRNRQFDLIPVIEAHPDLLGIGIDESTAIVVQGDHFQVMGAGYVLIFDHEHQLDSGGRFYFLAPGDRFDLKARVAERPSQGWTPLERVQPKPWPAQRRP
jgi:cyanophycinase